VVPIPEGVERDEEEPKDENLFGDAMGSGGSGGSGEDLQKPKGIFNKFKGRS
jgi:hypothetical protein